MENKKRFKKMHCFCRDSEKGLFCVAIMEVAVPHSAKHVSNLFQHAADAERCHNIFKDSAVELCYVM